MTYKQFLHSKIELAPNSGFKTDVGLMQFKDGTSLKPHQRDAINWAILGGRRALFESFGLGKTIQQLIICQKIIEYENGKALIICPLGVKQEFHQDAWEKLGIELDYVHSMEDIYKSKKSIHITNYEPVRDGKIDPNYYIVITLDEASILRTDNSKTHHTFIRIFKDIKYRFVATATPSPNDYIEIIFYAAFLGIMDKGGAKTRFFKRDSTKADKLTIYPHKEEEFWLWVSTWALFITKPSDLGYDDSGYNLPELIIHEHEIPVDHTTAGFDKTGQGILIREAAVSLQDASREKRDSMKSRCKKADEIRKNQPDDHFIFWHHLEAERKELKKLIPDLSEVYGSLDIPTREKRTIDFANGKTKYFGSKPSVSGSGCNFQKHCNNMIFVGINYKFNNFIQAIHRLLRYMQKKSVHVYLIYTESERKILKDLYEKWEKHKYMVNKMIGIIKKYGLSLTDKEKKLSRKMGIERIEIKKELFTAILNDSVEECKTIPDNSVHMILSSFPFAIQYEYSPNYCDFGHNKTNEDFFNQMDYLTPNMLRILKPGRIAAIHVKDRILFGNFTGHGFPSLYPFSDEVRIHMEKHGFIFIGRITITTDVVRENNQTYRLSWTENCKDGTKMGVGVPEYIMLFRKLPTDTSKGYADEPVVKLKKEYGRGRWQVDAGGDWRSSGDRLLELKDFLNIPKDQIGKIFKAWSRKNIYDYETHYKLADSLDEENRLSLSFASMQPGSHRPDVWDDIVRILTLNSSQKKREQEQHICPLQFDVCKRLIFRYTSKGETVFDPFAGLFTVLYIAIKMGRKGIGIELNPVSFNDGLVYLEMAENEITAPTLFDLDECLNEQEVI